MTLCNVELKISTFVCGLWLKHAHLFFDVTTLVLVFHGCRFPVLAIKSRAHTGKYESNSRSFQGLLKASPTVFKGFKLLKNTDLSVKMETLFSIGKLA